jgi:hypothetical protein
MHAGFASQTLDGAERVTPRAFSTRALETIYTYSLGVSTPLGLRAGVTFQEGHHVIE